ncbi:MAG TPA: enoyl-CoA hydratase-related protein [Polyangiaceae bacterium]|jgi:enoyl-CoA hydratase/carnithine racemase
MRDYGRIKVARDAGVETITLAYPERRNAIGPRMSNELLWALHDARAAEEVRVVVLTGEGKAFCSGGDFAEMTSGVTVSTLEPRGDYSDLLLALANSDKPVVAKVNGHAMGGGLGLVAACTFAVASTEAKLGTPEIDVGLFPMMIMAILARHVSRRRLLEMMLLGERLDAEEAARLGLVNRAVPAPDLDAEVKKITDALASKSPSTVRLGLEAFADQDDMDLETALPMLRTRLADVLSTDDAREGLMAFLEKRQPRWTGK